MLGVLIGRADRGFSIVNLFTRTAAGDAMIFDTCESPPVVRDQVGFQIIAAEIEPDIAVKITVTRVAGITFVPTPDLPGGGRIASKNAGAIRGDDRRNHAVPTAGTGAHQPTPIHD